MNLTFENLITDNTNRVAVASIVAFIVTFQATPLIIKICKNTGLMETPLKRSSHANPIPTFGGVAIFAGLLIGYLILSYGDEGIIIHRILAGIVILFFLGIKDDLYTLSPTTKIYTQILASAIVVIGSDLRISNFIGVLGIYELPYFFSVLFTIFIFVALTNAFNLVDGIDGLAAGIGMICCSFLGWWFISNGYWSLSCLSFTTAASLLAFLRFNLSKEKRIFMGDTGSLIIGFIITSLAIKYIHYNLEHAFMPNSIFISAPLLIIVLLCVPIFDTLRVFGLRIMRGRSPFNADRLHMHHLLVDNGLSHAATSSIFYFFTIAFTVLSYLLRFHISNFAMIFIILSAFVIYTAVGYRLEVRRIKVHRANKLAEHRGNMATKSAKNELKLKNNDITSTENIFPN